MIFGSRAPARTLVLLLAVVSPSLLRSQDAAGFHLKAGFDRPGLPVPKWSMQVEPSSRVTYTADHSAGAHALPDSPVLFSMSRFTGGKLRQLLDDSHGMQPCETKSKNLARMGMKSLEYQTGSAPVARCTFNYTDNKPLAAAAEMLLAISFTIEQGATLEWLHRYDRLGLDAAMTQLASAANEGRAQELQAVRPTLKSIANDEAVLDRVRQKAITLLAEADRVEALP